MLDLRSFGRCVPRAGGVLALLAVASCAATRDPDPIMGNTNWLQACEADRDCTGGLSCECGVCTRVCTVSGECEGLAGAVCDSESEALTAACGAGSTTALCLPAPGAGACEGEACEADDARADSGSDASGNGSDAGSDLGPMACEGPNPEGCAARGCPSGQRCDTSGDIECVSSDCSCDTETGSYVCTPDCRGGTCVALAPVDCEGPLTFTDPVLEQLVRVAIDKPSGDILAADVAVLTDLTNDGAGVDGEVSSLAGIQCLTSLSSITIQLGQITDLAPLVALDGLRFLTLNGHPDLSDISALAQIGTLEGVFITDTLVEDVSPLAGLSRTAEIALEGNRVRDVRPLQSLASLDLLWLSGNPLDCALNAAAITFLEDVGVAVDAPQCQ